MTLHSLESVLSCRREIGLLVNDSLSAVASHTHHRDKLTVDDEHMKHVAQSLETISCSLGLVVITTHSVMRSNDVVITPHSLIRFRDEKECRHLRQNCGSSDVSRPVLQRENNEKIIIGSNIVHQTSFNLSYKLPITQLFFSQVESSVSEGMQQGIVCCWMLSSMH